MLLKLQKNYLTLLNIKLNNINYYTNSKQKFVVPPIQYKLSQKFFYTHSKTTIELHLHFPYQNSNT